MRKNTPITSTSLLILFALVASISLFDLSSNNAYAANPQFATFVANDPDDGDSVYSNDDTLVITFDIPTNVTAGVSASQSDINGNFTFSQAPIGTTYTGFWDTNQQLTITVSDVSGNGGTAIGLTTVTVAGTVNIADNLNPDNANLITGTSGALTGDFGIVSSPTENTRGGGGDGSEHLTAITFGIDHVNPSYQRVENGIKVNAYSKTIDNNFHTEFPLQTAKVGILNTLAFKAYGYYPIEHLGFCLGHPEAGTPDSMGCVDAKLDQLTQKVLDVQISNEKENTFDDFSISASSTETNCNTKDDSVCSLIVFTFRLYQAPQDDVFSIYGIDNRNRIHQTYLNDGIDFSGASLNPPITEIGFDDNGRKYNLTIIDPEMKDRTVAVDENGTIWHLTGSFWTQEELPKIDSCADNNEAWDNRHCISFKMKMQGQALLASQHYPQEAPFADLQDAVTIVDADEQDKRDITMGNLLWLQ